MKLKVLFITVLSCIILFSACTAQPQSDIPKGMQLFSNDFVDYIAYVPNTWKISMSTQTLSAYVSSLDASNVTITAHTLDSLEQSMSLEEYWGKYDSQLKDTFSDLEYVGKTGHFKLGGVKADKYVYTATVTGVKYQFMQAVCINNGTVYIITFTTTPELFEEHTENIEKILNTFEFK
ncbi:MAG: DcrB-related protein [Clostridia bacterium]|nr:DcrB-related protein [Clostridia bacterium]